MAQFIYWQKSWNGIEPGQNGYKPWFWLKTGEMSHFSAWIRRNLLHWSKSGPRFVIFWKPEWLSLYTGKNHGMGLNPVKTVINSDLGWKGGWRTSFLPEFDVIRCTDPKAGPDMSYFENRNGSVYILAKITECLNPLACACVCVCVTRVRFAKVLVILWHRFFVLRGSKPSICTQCIWTETVSWEHWTNGTLACVG